VGGAVAKSLVTGSAPKAPPGHRSAGANCPSA
jgi:hypothetical protein